MILHLVRHPKPVIAPGICYGRLNISAENVVAVATRLRDELPPGLPVWSSPLQRCRELANLLHPMPKIDDRLAEMNFGDWEGRPWDSIPRLEIDAWAADVAGYVPPGGESALMLQQRALAFVNSLDLPEVVLVTHAGVIRTLLAHWQALPPAEWTQLLLAYGSCTTIELPVKSTMASAGTRMAAMKIAIIRQRYNPYGGAERFVERALGALVAEGTEVTLITRNWDGAPREGFRTIICDPSPGIWLAGRAGRDKAFTACVQQVIAAGDFDLVQSHERVPGCSIFRAGDGVHAAWLAQRARFLPPWRRLAQRFSPFHRHVLAAEEAMFSHPALRAVICNSHMVADEIVQYYGVDRSMLLVIYNGVDTHDFHPRLADLHRASVRQSLGLSGTTPVLLYVGSGYERKGVPQLLRAFVSAAKSGAHLLVVGADRKLNATRRLAERLGISECTHFLGPVKDVRPFYGAADAFVLPTLYDPCPNAALEAMACGLPILTGIACGAREWVVEGQNGLIVDPLSENELARALDKLIHLSMEPAAHLLARQSVEALDLPTMSSRLLALYHRLSPQI